MPQVQRELGTWKDSVASIMLPIHQCQALLLLPIISTGFDPFQLFQVMTFTEGTASPTLMWHRPVCSHSHWLAVKSSQLVESWVWLRAVGFCCTHHLPACGQAVMAGPLSVVGKVHVCDSGTPSRPDPATLHQAVEWGNDLDSSTRLAHVQGTVLACMQFGLWHSRAT